MNNLTNQELLTELQKRIDEGNIDINVNSEVNEVASNLPTMGLSNSKMIILLGFLCLSAGIILFFNRHNHKVTTVSTNIEIQSKNN